MNRSPVQLGWGLGFTRSDFVLRLTLLNGCYQCIEYRFSCRCQVWVGFRAGSFANRHQSIMDRVIDRKQDVSCTHLLQTLKIINEPSECGTR